MPVFDTSTLQNWNVQMQSSAAAGQWDRVQQLDQLLGQWLQTPSAFATVPMQIALRQVQQVHSTVMQQCVSAKQDAAAQLRLLETSQEAQRAYAWQEGLE